MGRFGNENGLEKKEIYDLVRDVVFDNFIILAFVQPGVYGGISGIEISEISFNNLRKVNVYFTRNIFLLSFFRNFDLHIRLQKSLSILIFNKMT